MGDISKPVEATGFQWAIASRTKYYRKPFLYTGTWPTKREAIAAHVEARYGPVADLKADWERCFASGDRAVKVRLSIVGGDPI